MSAKREFWKEYWNILGDPFSGAPLSYAEDGTERLIVETASVRRVAYILDEIELPTLARRYYIIGQRGMGKSTLLNYAIRESFRLFDKKRILPIFVNTIVEEKDSDRLRLNFLTSTIEALFQAILIDLKRFRYPDETLFLKFSKLRETYFDQKGMRKIDSGTAEEFLYHLLVALRDSGVKQFLLLYDELDKIDNYGIVLDFIRKSQSLMENLTGKFNCLVFISGIPDWINLLSKDEFSGVRGESISLESWSPEDVVKLISLRLKYFTYGKYRNPFSHATICDLCERAQGRPRRILELAKALLIWGANQRTDYFGEDFCAKMFWRNGSITRFLDALSSEETLFNACEKLRIVYDVDKDDPAVYYLLTLIHSVEKYLDLPQSELRRRYGIDMDETTHKNLLGRLEATKAVEKRREAFSYYTVANEFKMLFQYVTRTLGESLEYLPYVIKMRRPGIIGFAEEFSLRQEVIAALSNTPAKSFKPNELVESILRSPDTKERALRYYSAENKMFSERELHTRFKIGIRPVLNKLCREGYVLRQQRGRTFAYRWFPKYIDVSRFKDFTVDERVMKDLEAAGQNFSSGLYDPAVSTSRSAVENALRTLYETVMQQNPPRNMTIDNLNQFLLDKKVYDRGLFSLILGFCQQTNPIVHREVTQVSEETARVLLDLSQNIIGEIFDIREKQTK